MDIQRILEIYEGLKTCKRNKTAYCNTVKGELGITSKDLVSIKVNNPTLTNSVNTEPHKLIKAIGLQLRKLIFNAAVENKVIEINGALPPIGYWKEKGGIVRGLSKQCKILVTKEAETIHLDPFSNNDFLLEMIRVSLI